MAIKEKLTAEVQPLEARYKADVKARFEKLEQVIEHLLARIEHFNTRSGHSL